MVDKELAEDVLKFRQSVSGADPTGTRRLAIALWYFPAFEEGKSWGVFEPGRYSWEPAMVRELTRSPQSSLRVDDRKIDWEGLTKLLNRGWGICVPVFTTESDGLDGETFGIRTRGIELEWWREGPPEWNELTRWAYDLRRFLTEGPHGRID